MSATSSGTIITLSSVSTGVTSYQVSRPNTATETLVQGLNPNGVETAVIAGTKSTGDTVTITVFDGGISGGSKAESYVVQSTDTLGSIAAGLAGVISGDSTLAALGITASSSSTVVNLSSMSNNLTTYAKSTSTGATETITLGQSTGITAFSYNNLNELTNTSAGGAARFQGTTNKPIVSATIDSTVKANLPNSTSFSAQPSLSSGSNATTVNVVDGNNNSVTNPYQIGVRGGPSASLSFDANGNTTNVESSYCLPLWDMLGRSGKNADSERSFVSSGGKVILGKGDLTHRESRSKESVPALQDLHYMRISPLSMEKSALVPESGGSCTDIYSWDAENRLIKITYPGTNNFSTLAYDGLGRNVSIVETTAGSVTSTKNFVWCGDKLRPNSPCEERDASSTLTKRFFNRGQMNLTNKYFYQSDQLGSMREVTDNSGTIQAEYSYAPYGQITRITELVASDFQYARYYAHARSGLYFPFHRLYNAQSARWLSRDPMEETIGGPQQNLYVYANNRPIDMLDPTGLDCCWGPSSPPSGPHSPCGLYGTETFMFVSEQCVCMCLGDGDWPNKVRHCLWCRRASGDSNDYSRHFSCVAMHPNAEGLVNLVSCRSNEFK